MTGSFVLPLESRMRRNWGYQVGISGRSLDSRREMRRQEAKRRKRHEVNNSSKLNDLVNEKGTIDY